MVVIGECYINYRCGEMKITLILVLVIIGISVIAFINMQKSEVGIYGKNESKVPIENRSITENPGFINQTRVKEIEQILNEIEAGNISIMNKEIIVEKLASQSYVEVTIWMKSKEKIDEILSIFNPEEFKIVAIFRTYPPYTINGNITLDGIEKLKDNPDVEKMDIIGHARATLRDSTSLINADDAWLLQINNLNITGNNITVCVVDSGVNYTHPDLGGCSQSDFLNGNCRKVIGGYDFVDFNDNDPMDDNGHGTHIAGIVTANGSIKGIAPDSNITALKVLKQDGTGSLVDIREGIDWCIDNRNTYNIKIITISIAKTDQNGDEIIYTSSCDDVDQMVTAANNARTYGIFVDAASGNSGSKSGITSPACGSNVTSVGATNDKYGMSVTWTTPDPDCTDNPTYVDQIACGTNRASILDLLTPGAKINSTYLSPSNYFEDWGTSMAAPHVAGVAALMKQANNSLTPAEIENLLKKTGKPIYDNYTDLTFRRVDALKAVLASYNPLVTTDLQVLNENVTNVTFEFKIFNAVNATLTDVYWIFDTGNGTTYTNKNNQNITLKAYEEVFIHLQHNYSTVGNFTVTAYANSSWYDSNFQNIDVSVEGINLKLTNFTIINSSGTQRTFEFFIENDGTSILNNIYWNMTVTNEGGVNGTQPITLASGEGIFVYVNYNYTTGGLHNVTVKADPSNIIREDKEGDNEVTITNN